MKTFLIFFIIPVIFSLNIGGIASTVLDFVPGVGNVKSLGEAVLGKDIITGEKLSATERTLSLLGAIPGGNYLKNTKHLKNGKKFLKAAQRAQKVGKVKNAVSFAKASARAMAKAEKVPKMINNAFKAAKTFFKTRRNEDKKENEKEREKEKESFL